MIEKIWLKDFRNFDNQVFEFSSETTIIIGPNASGKTNILESINLLATGKSFKARKEQEMINHDSDVARVKGKLPEDTLEVMLTPGQITRGSITEKSPRKRLLVNNTGKQLRNFISHFQTVVFRPQDLDLITQSPSLRRKFLDNVLSLADREYYRSLLSYEKGLRRRNKVLQQIRDEGISRSSLHFWDRLIIKNGEYITKKRTELIKFINDFPQISEKKYLVEYDSSTISEKRLERYSFQETAAGTTLVGPHRDDILIKLNKRDLSSFGSRGEQRMGVLWLKLAELEYLKSTTETKPVLLLDDIFSELDQEHRSLINTVMDSQQTIITLADKHFMEEFSGVEIINL